MDNFSSSTCSVIFYFSLVQLTKCGCVSYLLLYWAFGFFMCLGNKWPTLVLVRKFAFFIFSRLQFATSWSNVTLPIQFQFFCALCSFTLCSIIGHDQLVPPLGGMCFAWSRSGLTPKAPPHRHMFLEIFYVGLYYATQTPHSNLISNIGGSSSVAHICIVLQILIWL